MAEDNGSGTVTRTYGYDGRQQLIADSSAGTGCENGQAYAYDAAGNRTCAAGRGFTYLADGTGQLDACSGTDCDPTYDADGRTTRLVTASGTWTYGYDAEGRLVSACKAASCTGTGFARLDMAYDAEGHRISLTETPATGSATVTTFTYAGDAVVRETSVTGTTTVTRTFTLDEAGAIVKMTRATSGGSTADDGTYLVVWNGHGDAVELSRINADGTLSPANRFSYTTWGTPALATVGSFGDLGFRYRYVGRYDVQWDSTGAVPAGLLYMHARHYSPEIGRFLQPDPSAMEANLYGYAEGQPTVQADPDGLFGSKLCLCGGVGGLPNWKKLLEKLLRNPSSFQGGSVKDVIKIMRNSGWPRTPAKKGVGVKYDQPGHPGDQVRIMKGSPNAKSPDHRGHYAMVTKNGVKTRVLLRGNPGLNQHY